jgi:hypothetical protein
MMRFILLMANEGKTLSNEVTVHLKKEKSFINGGGSCGVTQQIMSYTCR